MDGQTVPQVAPIGNTGASSSIPSIDQIISMSLPVQAAVPPATTVQHAPNPTLPVAHDHSPTQLQQPISGDLHDKKQARMQNNWANVTNTIQKFAKNQEDKHIQTVTHNVTTVMGAQQQIDNAQTILSNPKNYSKQDLANAQSVLDKNKGVLDRLFSDKKISKDLQKAFDVSFTDPEKNNTPEVKAMQDAKKEFDTSKNSGLNVDNPQEKRVQELVTGGTQGNMQPQDQQHRQITNNPNASAHASYADQFMKQVPNALGTNPQYTQALKDAEEARKTIGKAIAPIINATAAAERNKATLEERGKENERTNDARVKAAKLQALSRTTAMAMSVKGAMDRVNRQIQGREEIITKRETTPANQEKLSLDNLKILQDANAKLNKQIIDNETEKTTLAQQKWFHGSQAEKDYDTMINDAKAHIKSNNEIIGRTNIRLSNLGYKGSLSNGGTNITSESIRRDNAGTETTNGNSVGSDEDPDDFDEDPIE